MARFNASGMFQPFSLADAIKDNQAIQLNKLKIGAIQGEQERQRTLKQMASESVKPVYEDQPDINAEGPPTSQGEFTQEQVDPIQTGTEFDDEAYAEKLKKGGEMEMAQKLEAHLGTMDKQEREEKTYKLEAASRVMANVTNEEQFNAAEEELVRTGVMTREEADAQEYSQENVTMIQDAGRAVKDIYATNKKTSLFGKINPDDYTRESVVAFEASGKYGDLIPIKDEGSKFGITDGSEFERNVMARYRSGQITEDEAWTELDKRAGTLTGERGEHQTLSASEKRAKEVRVSTTKMRKEAREGGAHFNGQRTAINDALAALNSGQNRLSDTMLTSVLTGLTQAKSGLKAFAMYEEFNTVYGNLAERLESSLKGFFAGAKTDADRRVIRDTVMNFKKYSDPAAAEVRSQYRSQARVEGLDPWSVVPPTSAKDIKYAPGFTTEERLEAFRRYPQYMPKGKK